MPARKSELWRNTVATTLWNNGALAASILSVPLLTRFLSQTEYGLWLQLLALSAVAAVADLGLQSVFVRRLTGSNTGGARDSLLNSAVTFYVLMAAGLLIVCLTVALLPGGLISPFLGASTYPRMTAILMIVPMAANLAVVPRTVVLLSTGDMGRERLYGVGPAIVGTLGTLLAALTFHRAIAMAVTYSTVEIVFDLALLRNVDLGRRRARLAFPARSLFVESWRVLLLQSIPQVAVAVGATIVAHATGPASVAIYGVSIRASDTVRRIWAPLTDSIFISFCRAGSGQLERVQKCARLLPWAVVAGGSCVSLTIASLGKPLVTSMFGPEYAGATQVMVILSTSATIAVILTPHLRQLQASGKLGWVPALMGVGLLGNVAVSIPLTTAYGLVGTAGALLGESVLVDATVVILSSRLSGSDSAAASQLLLACSAALLALCVALYITQSGASPAAGVGIVLGLLTGTSTAVLVRYYMAAASEV